MKAEGAPLRLTERVAFHFATEMTPEEAVDFVRDVRRSLSAATFLEGLTVSDGATPLVTARLPVDTHLFGRHDLPFTSELVLTEAGARLLPKDEVNSTVGWAEVAGEATVTGSPSGSLVHYTLDLTAHLQLPAPEGWGTRALLRMVELTGERVMRELAERFPAAVREAAELQHVTR